MEQRIAMMAVALAVASALGVACTSDPEAPPSGPGSGGSGGGGGVTYGTSDCGTCVAMTACSTERGACDAEPSCASWLGCLNGCPPAAGGDADPVCEAACPEVAGSTALALKDAFQGCRAGAGASCAACGRTPPDGGGGGGAGGQTCEPPAFLTQQCAASSEADPCIKCNFEECCDSVDAVFYDPGPVKDLADCWLDCQTAACEEDCYGQFPDGIVGFGEYSACVFNNCNATGACTSSSGCGLCQYQECGCELANCLTNVECALSRACLTTCNGDVACGQACFAAHPEAAALNDALGTCSALKCVQACGN